MELCGTGDSFGTVCNRVEPCGTVVVSSYETDRMTRKGRDAKPKISRIGEGSDGPVPFGTVRPRVGDP